ncbi:MAG: UDP-N-acetylmuramate--L-alanine ligase [Chloroflexi bacterium]|nr:UDP-N-acetylmuramate--L-alanine ligase [Chloroflexota bacterium]MCY3582226.1 UDP-N-acetylmuramate--L-alanine ligase [Chloroflexota bacterium]MCY3715034.1 UDP-N-acetylmuramate--L-alanine ligase [Chloroflexota bacterium]MDE2650560.1 UDP-N-acetylmuramate--L-alanine ligase [Chloroflexota bacterium]MXV92485.1 UDP-N-acetylmuramate--L-alanine ligase [Chloroflexota bacterium]
MLLAAGRHIHFVGIGGAGLSAIARILLGRGMIVSGSDSRPSDIMVALAKEGARVEIGHAAEFVYGADAVLASSAVPDDHIEVVAARALGIPVYRRRQFMRALLAGFDTLAVAGAHGKTTTTAMLTHILQCAGQDPSYIVGGIMGNTSLNAAVGAGDCFVIEADEYDNMFLGLSPDLAIVTNIEHDHPDFFATAADVRAAFSRFAAQIKPDGLLIACADNPPALELAASRRAQGGRALSYGISSASADWRAVDLRSEGFGSQFTVRAGGKVYARARLGLPGAHNALNALAALVAAQQRGVSIKQGAAALAGFISAGRRFELRGERDGIAVIDDYAHHPTAIRANLATARRSFPQRQLWAIWQPHTYTRVQRFHADFIAAFDAADRVLVTPIYAAREEPIAGFSSSRLARAISARCPAMYTPTFADAATTIRAEARRPATVLICSAGDANQIAELLLGDDA